MSIYIIDEIMGRGKTSAMINHINKSTEEEKFLFITPYLAEVERIKNSCPQKRFKTPNAEGGKLNNIKKLFAKGHNIVSTHALFMMFDDDIFQSVKDYGYTLIIDEVVNVVNITRVSKYDAEILSDSGCVEIDSDGKMRWIEKEYNGVFDDTKKTIETNDIFMYGDNVWVGLLPMDLFTSFKNVYIMTYMFDGQLQRGYFDMQGISYSYKYISGDSVENYSITDTPSVRIPIDYRPLIKIVDNRRMYMIGDSEHALSKGWYEKNLKKDGGDTLRKNVLNFFKNCVDTKASENLWTTFCDSDDEGLDCKTSLSGNGFTKGFLPCNARGTNNFKNRRSLAYLVNRYVSPVIKQLFFKNDIEFDEDKYALSEMIQWIWRSAIRDGKEIYVYIPSKRMRNLLTAWLDEISNPVNDI